MKLSKIQGISLIEVLVTTLILAVGLLGVAALQLSSISNNQSGYLRSQASAIGNDLASRIRAKKMAFYGGITDAADIVVAYSEAPYNCDNAVTSCDGNRCTDDEVATFDKWQACDFARDQLPDGEVFVRNVAGTRMAIAIAWTPVQTRADLGQGDTSNFINPRCAALGVAAAKDCVIFEVIP